mgnify:FL=1
MDNVCNKHGSKKVWVADKSRSRGGKWRCRECARESSRKWKGNNPEVNLIHRRNWVANNTDKVKEYNKDYNLRWRTLNLEKSRAYARYHYKLKPWLKLESGARRRAKKKDATCQCCSGEGYHAAASGTCYVCEDLPATETDHVMPLAIGGRHCRINFRGICPGCNKAKYSKVWPGHPDWHNFLLGRRTLK